jgi:hypothetical protein
MSSRHLPPVPGSHRRIRIVEEPVMPVDAAEAPIPAGDPRQLIAGDDAAGAPGRGG